MMWSKPQIFAARGAAVKLPRPCDLVAAGGRP